MNITFLTRSLDYGGAERQMVVLAQGLDKTRFDVSVMCFYGGGPLQAELEQSGIHVYPLNKRGRWDTLSFFRRLIKQVGQLKPDVLHAYLEVSNILLILLKLYYPAVRMVFGVRASFMDTSRYDWMYELVLRIESVLSSFADLIIVNSVAGRMYCERRGFAKSHILVIPNGIDTQRYQPNRASGQPLRSEWGVPDDGVLIGLVGRIDPMKDHPTFLKAAAQVIQNCPHAYFVCVGDGSGAYRQHVQKISQALNLGERLVWAGARSDMPAVYNALDINCSSSYGEGFSNIIGEAMACGVPCVVTNVGDSALIVSDTSLVVPPKRPEALAKALQRLVNLPPQERMVIGQCALRRVETEFNLQRMVSTTEDALERLVSQ